MDAPRDAVLLPCKHLSLCGPCAGALLMARHAPRAGAAAAAVPRCPLCREPVDSYLRAFV